MKDGADENLADALVAYHTKHDATPSAVDITEDNISEVKIDYNLFKENKENWINGENNQLAKKLHDAMDSLKDLINKLLTLNSAMHSVDSWATFWVRKYTPRPEGTPLRHTNHDIGSGMNDGNNAPIIHYDFNSTYKNEGNQEGYATPDMASVSIALNDPDEYEGGDILISNGFKQDSPLHFQHDFITISPRLSKGDAVIWDGWTLHGVTPVTSGARYVLVVHFQGTLSD
jgi:ectoine hydroxylase-related dioxygenase (phytanoyl-CoA dioxygenase family)